MDKELPQIIELKDWLSVHAELLKKDKVAAYMQCCIHKLSIANEIILCDVKKIPKEYTTGDVVAIIEGKHIKL